MTIDEVKKLIADKFASHHENSCYPACYDFEALGFADAILTALEAKGLVIVKADVAEDAKRYRWLRHRNLNTIHKGGVFAGQTHQNMVLNLDTLDAAIDRAMLAARGE